MVILWILIIGALAGWLAGLITRGGGFGLIGDIVVGIVGAFIGGHLFAFLGVFPIGFVGVLFSATVGAVILLLVIRVIRRAA